MVTPGRATIDRPGRCFRLPLDGLRVLEFTTFQAGPLVGVSLTSLGADLIRSDRIPASRPVPVRRARLPIDRAWERNVSASIVADLGKHNITLDSIDPQSMRSCTLSSAERACWTTTCPSARRCYRGLHYNGLRALKSYIVIGAHPPGMFGRHGEIARVSPTRWTRRRVE